ncbi:MAG TPA: hypothetical protein G4O10_02980 [Dehalococcoidia bacterium]|nr:hypothetical protein [Dehalococcoidia bacterium]
MRWWGILLSNQLLPEVKKLAIVTNGGGSGIIAAVASARNSLLLPEFSEDAIDKLKYISKRDVRLNDPLDRPSAYAVAVLNTPP